MVGHPNDGPADPGSKSAGARTARPGAIAALLAGYAICRGLFLIGVIPPWQGPDEPGHAEYALVLARGGGSPAAADPGLEAAILASMAEHRFYGHVRAPAPARPPARFTDVDRLRDAPTQLADETPIGYIPFAAALVATGTDGAPDLDDVAAALYRMRLAALALVLATAALTWRMASGMLGSRLAPAAVAVLVAAPWMGHAAAVVNTDLSAVALAAAWFAALARIGRAPDRRPSHAIVLAILAVAAALAKRTALFLVPLTVGVVAVWGWGWVRRRRVGDRPPALTPACLAATAPQGGPPPLRRGGRLWRRWWGLAKCSLPCTAGEGPARSARVGVSAGAINAYTTKPESPRPGARIHLT